MLGFRHHRRLRLGRLYRPWAESPGAGFLLHHVHSRLLGRVQDAMARDRRDHHFRTSGNPRRRRASCHQCPSCICQWCLARYQDCRYDRGHSSLHFGLDRPDQRTARLVGKVCLFQLSGKRSNPQTDMSPFVRYYNITQDGGPYLTLQLILGYICYPVAFLLGVPRADLQRVGELIGVKVIANEFVAYNSLTSEQKYLDMSPRSKLIATYALCGKFFRCSILLPHCTHETSRVRQSWLAWYSNWCPFPDLSLPIRRCFSRCPVCFVFRGSVHPDISLGCGHVGDGPGYPGAGDILNNEQEQSGRRHETVKSISKFRAPCLECQPLARLLASISRRVEQLFYISTSYYQYKMLYGPLQLPCVVDSHPYQTRMR